jgi:hypothetical protein
MLCASFSCDRNFLLDSLTILKNRGYDSAGLATLPEEGGPMVRLTCCVLAASADYLLPLAYREYFPWARQPDFNDSLSSSLQILYSFEIGSSCITPHHPHVTHTLDTLGLDALCQCRQQRRCDRPGPSSVQG